MSTPRDAGPDARIAVARGPAYRRRGERLVALLVAGVLALNFPLLAIFRDPALIAGIPALYCYLFSVWALIIAAVAFILRGRPPEQPRPPAAGGKPEP